MSVTAKIDGIDYPVRTISGTHVNVFTNFDEPPPQALLDMMGDGTTHELIAVHNGVGRERWTVVFGGFHSDYAPEQITAFIAWNVMTHQIIEVVTADAQP